MEIELRDPESAHIGEPPASMLCAKEWQFKYDRYDPGAELAKEPVHRPIYRAMREIAKNIGREPLISPRGDLAEAVRMVMPDIEALRVQIADWSGESKWIAEFHAQLDRYSHIFATDLQERSSIESARYGQYLRQQLLARLKKLWKRRSEGTLYFSPRVHEAINRTGWMPDQTLWGEQKFAESDDKTDELEIVRILLRDSDTPSEIEMQALSNIDTDHKLFAAPLFVANVTAIEKNHTDFAIGMDANNDIVRCGEFNPKSGRVEEVVDDYRREELYETLNELLSSPSLQTVSQYLGVKPMKFIPTYNDTRGPSHATLERFEKYFEPLQRKDIGLDIGCGTGNYTFPMLSKFNKLYGVDINEEMLEIAEVKQKETYKTDRISWIRRDAISIPDLSNESCDAIWAISTLHYFSTQQQQLLFKEISRLLRRGGRVLIDTEFLEQHASLWVVEFFPSLKDRYKGRLFSREQYELWLRQSGLNVVAFDCFKVPDDDADMVLRVGQRHPERYLKWDIIRNIPAFFEMNPHERKRGQRDLKQAIDNGKIEEVMYDYTERAALEGDISLIVAEKP